MRVSVVTPSFNQGNFLEQTIRSVLEQSYSDIEYIILDGGSTDRSVEMIRKYESRLAHWQSAKDEGAWDAVNQGWNRATGEILCYLNSDDVLTQNAIGIIVEHFEKNPEIDVVYGDAIAIDSAGKELYPFLSEKFDLAKIFRTWDDPIRQPTCFIRRRVFEKYGGLDESYEFCADFEYWIRIAATSRFLYLPETFALIRLHPDSKTIRLEDIQARELIRLCNQVLPTQQFLNSGVQPEEALAAAYHKAMMHFRKAGHKIDALGSYYRYCRIALSPFYGFYRFSRFCASLLLRK